jgi:DNA-binding transcriptional LysR family regulator
LHMVDTDLDTAVLVRIRVEDMPRNTVMPMKAVYRKDSPPGPAGRAFIAKLKG